MKNESGTTAGTTYAIEGLHCGACVARVTAAARGLDGVTSAEATLDPPRLHVRGRHERDRLDEAVAAAGNYQLGETIADSEIGDATRPGGDANPGRGGRLGTYYPLALVVGFLIAGVAVIAARADEYGLRHAGADFMGLFFVAFAFFKILDLRGFRDAYRSYDLLARAWPTWGLIYPFVELALGGAYLLRLWPAATNAVTLTVMLLGGAGVVYALSRRRAIRCACLGTVFDLPMSTVTLVEDFGMAAMAAAMLFIGPE